MLDLTLFRVPTFVGASLAAFSVSAAGFDMLVFSPRFFLDVEGASPPGAGVGMLPFGLAARPRTAGPSTRLLPRDVRLCPGVKRHGPRVAVGRAEVGEPLVVGYVPTRRTGSPGRQPPHWRLETWRVGWPRS